MKKSINFILSGLLIAAVSLPLASSVEAAKVYTWKDASGIVHYSDKPFPKARQKKTIEIKAARPRENVQSESSAVNNATNADSQKIKRECVKARNNLVTLASAKNIKKRDAEGNEVTLSETAIQSEVQRNQNFINQNCQVSTSVNRNSSEDAFEEAFEEEFSEGS